MFGYTDVEPSQLKQLLTNRDVMLVDVRTPTESARASIPGARNIPLHLLPLRKQDFSDDRTIVFYCHNGRSGTGMYRLRSRGCNRSAQACAFMIGQGWRNVCNLGNRSRRCPTSAIHGVVRGGIVGWLQHGQPVAAPAN